jgi:hypothetical protein
MDRRRKRLAALAVAGLFLVAIIVAGLLLSKNAGLTAHQPTRPDALPVFNGRVTATILSVDRTAGTARVRIEAQAWTDLSVRHTEAFVFSPQPKTLKGSRSWTTTREKDFSANDRITDDNHRVLKLIGATQESEVRAVWIRANEWFPFDAWQLTLEPKGCIGQNVFGCVHAEPIFFSDVRVQLSDGFRSAERAVIRRSEGGPQRLRVTVQRQPFLQILPIVFLIVSALYIYYLFEYEARKDLVVKSLALFAALWGFRGILVPQQLPIFPTAIDYGILLVGAATFLLTLIKAEREGGNDANRETAAVGVDHDDVRIDDGSSAGDGGRDEGGAGAGSGGGAAGGDEGRRDPGEEVRGSEGGAAPMEPLQL